MEVEEARGGDKPGGYISDILVDSDGNNVTKQIIFRGKSFLARVGVRL